MSLRNPYLHLSRVIDVPNHGAEIAQLKQEVARLRRELTETQERGDNAFQAGMNAATNVWLCELAPLLPERLLLTEGGLTRTRQAVIGHLKRRLGAADPLGCPGNELL